MPRRLPEPNYPAGADVRRVRSNGEIKWKGNYVFVSTALVGEPLAIEETSASQWLVRFYAAPIGYIDPKQNKLRPLEGGEGTQIKP